eukprot:s119_g16.t1
MFQVSVSFSSGRSETLSLPHLATVRDLRVLAQTSFGQRCLKLASESGHVLTDMDSSLEASGIQDGDLITAVAQLPKLVAARRAFAMRCPGGDKIVAWGDSNYGGDSSEVQRQLRNVQQVQAALYAFAAILCDGSVVTWGDSNYGGDSSQVQN